MHVLSYRSTKAEFGFHIVIETRAPIGTGVLSIEGAALPLMRRGKLAVVRQRRVRFLLAAVLRIVRQRHYGLRLAFDFRRGVHPIT